MKKKILMAVNSFRGHAAPIMALSAELVRRGHEMTLSTGKEESVFGKSSSLWEEDAHPRMRFVESWDQHELMQELGSSEMEMFTRWGEMNDLQVGPADLLVHFCPASFNPSGLFQYTSVARGVVTITKGRMQ